MAFDLDLVAFEGKRINVGLSAIIGITVTSSQAGAVFKYISGGTCEIGGATLAAGIGYVLASGEAVSLNARGTFYVTASGATAVCMLFRGGTDTAFGS